MPTGYTAIIEDDENVTFEQYAWRCARAFGALVLLRDDPLEARVPERFEPSAYYAEAVKRDESRLAELLSMTPEQAEALYLADFESKTKHYKKYVAENARLMERYRRMADRVSKWAPPTPDHTKLREFMLQQIETSLPYQSAQELPKPVPAPKWLVEHIASAKSDLDRSRKCLADEVARCKQRNEWLAALRASIGPQP
jgi:hypothetical protein